MKLDSILATTDLTEGSDDILRSAAAIAAVTGATLHVLHAFDFQRLPYPEERTREITFAGRIEEANRVLDEQIRRAVPAGVTVGKREVVVYVAHKAIAECADEVDADLVVLGPHRRRAVADAFLGSTAERVIRTVNVPCLVVRGNVSLPLRRVLVPMDLSRPGVEAFDRALSLADALGVDPPDSTEVVAVHVIPRMFDLADYAFDSEVIAPELHREVEDAAERVDLKREIVLREEVRWGDSPADEILKLAEEERTDLLVVATHGHGAVARALIGGIAEAVVRRAKSPVLLVPPTPGRATG